MATTPKVTCTPLYQEAVRLGKVYIRNTTLFAEDDRLLALGFLIGLSEKVYLGACQAAMGRPPLLEVKWELGLAKEVAGVYGLQVRTLDYYGDALPGTPTQAEHRREIWILREGASPLWDALKGLSVNGPAWHTVRALLCGIPASEIDTHFDQRVNDHV